MSTALAISPEVDRSLWLEERRNGIGASESPIVMGITGSRLRLYFEKRGELPGVEQTKAMRRGLKWEPYIAADYQEQTGDAIVSTQWFKRHPEMPWISATIDGVTESGRILEFKSVGPYGDIRHIDDTGDLECLPNKWVIQAHQQMLVSGKDEVTFAILMPDHEVYVMRPLPRIESVIGMITNEVGEFWNSHVKPGIPPEEELRPDDADLLIKVFRGNTGEILQLGAETEEHARAYLELAESIRDLEDHRKLHKAHLLHLLGDAAGGEFPGGWSVSRKSITVNHKAKEAHTSEQVRLTVKEPRS